MESSYVPSYVGHFIMFNKQTDADHEGARPPSSQGSQDSPAFGNHGQSALNGAPSPASASCTSIVAYHPFRSSNYQTGQSRPSIHLIDPSQPSIHQTDPANRHLGTEVVRQTDED